MRYKTPISVLVVIHTPSLQVLLLERALHVGFWQSVTGSLEASETPLITAQREVAEETGIHLECTQFLDWQQTYRYEIYSQWRHRYAPEVTHNTEHVFSLQVPESMRQHPIQLAAHEHRAYCWLDYKSAAAQCFSPSNRDTILALPTRRTVL